MSLILRGIDFGSVIGASGVQNIFGEGYPYHRVLKLMFPLGFRFNRMGFTAKTVTLNKNPGNMPLCSDGVTPQEIRPKCIFVNLRKGIALNAVGLSNHGIRYYLEQGKWQSRGDNFTISLMAIGKTEAERLEEINKFVEIILGYIRNFRGKICLQINFSCPNVGLHLVKIINEVKQALDIASEIGVPLVPKFNVLIHPDIVGEISRHKYCDAVCISNTIPWGMLPDKIDWKELFGTDESPLKSLGGGGLSGAPLLPIVIDWLERARCIVNKPIIAGGGILSAQDVKTLSYLRPAAVSLGTIAMVRPWRVQSAIRASHQYI